MIGYLQGKIIDANRNSITLLVNGVGYLVFIPSRILSTLSLEAECELYIYTHVREDALNLYGFTTKADRDMFIVLLAVSGVGAKTALAIVSQANADAIATAIRAADVDFFSAIPGIGKKSAQRIIVDLKSKIGTTKELDLSAESEDSSQAQLALRSLGFSSQEAKEALAKIPDKSTLSEPELIKQALRQLGK